MNWPWQPLVQRARRWNRARIDRRRRRRMLEGTSASATGLAGRLRAWNTRRLERRRGLREVREILVALSQDDAATLEALAVLVRSAEEERAAQDAARLGLERLQASVTALQALVAGLAEVAGEERATREAARAEAQERDATLERRLAVLEAAVVTLHRTIARAAEDGEPLRPSMGIHR